MLVGSIAQVAGMLVYCGGVFFIYVVGSRSSQVEETMEIVMALMPLSALLVFGGMILFSIAFVAYCARAGAAEKRVAELEEMLGHL